MGRNISIYLNDDDLKWLDQLCKGWGVGRSQAIHYTLLIVKLSAHALIPILEVQNLGDLKKIIGVLR